ncbi:hypothetical protein ALC62_09752 [Cyphomyrmex costatus]|uniref:Uncharacterized protein n=1 Tax=Cyphomyrmex costatus TaxID=456900 RepID=A0A151IF36_9HYME|nr:hypothetical protein ALC62_09752 [Cyphomyrmex costatus]
MLLGVLVVAVAKKKRCSKKRYWVSPLLQKRFEHGFYNALLPTLRLEDLRFNNYFRMSASEFEDLLMIVGPRLQKMYIVRKPISAAERLSVTLSPRVLPQLSLAFQPSNQLAEMQDYYCKATFAFRHSNDLRKCKAANSITCEERSLIERKQ